MLAGFAIFVVGSAGAAFLGARGSGGSGPRPAKVPVQYTAGPIAPGMAAAAALTEGRITTKTVDPATRPANAVTNAAQLARGVAVAAIPADTIVTTDMFPDPQTRIGTVAIPPGKRALSLELKPMAGIAGFAGAGDRVDVYAVAHGEGAAAGVRLIFQGIEVLNVNGIGLPEAQGQPGGAALVYLLAVTPADAERLIYLNEFEKLYFDLIPKGEGPVKTPGAGPSNVLAA